ncbi:MAG: dialkylresorcinol condensing enzyme DarA [Flavobacteriaceae bacterium]
MKRVLVLYYSQTGQLLQILKNVVSRFPNGRINVDFLEIKPKKAFGFPWKQQDFYNAFPESFLQVPTELHPPGEDILSKKYDLVILGYQVWFLTPSIPINSFLKSPHAQPILKDVPVVTVVACRNMWVMAQEKLKHTLAEVGARHVGHIALTDRHINHVSVITISHWMFSGKKDRYLGVFPKPGVSDKDISEAARFGTPIQEALEKGSFESLQMKLLEKGAVRVSPFLVTTDKRGNIIFSKWANHIIQMGGAENPKRLKWIGIFKYYLLFAIWVIAPIVFIVFLLTYLPMYHKHKRDKAYYSSVALKRS